MGIYYVYEIIVFPIVENYISKKKIDILVVHSNCSDIVLLDNNQNSI